MEIILTSKPFPNPSLDRAGRKTLLIQVVEKLGNSLCPRTV